ncbi:MAG: sugar ABC transporter ATP-binding protein [Gemmatales bacterium]|nr:MAG: sugar ABC transporter ATP-binding protein [Gemmatales bacterium]
MAAVAFVNLCKIFARHHVVIRDLSLTIESGETLVLVGPSGSGKTTTLRLLAGLEHPTAGRVFIHDSDVTDLPPHRRGIAMVFQNPALIPHKTVRANLEFGLRLKGVDRIAERVRQTAATLHLDNLLDRKPHELSGGEKQRVALARAMIREPAILLLDEPLSNLDPPQRLLLRSELAQLKQKLEFTMLYVTHDQEEAMSLADRIAVLDQGTLRQVGTPTEIYGHPTDTFVAGFFGTPPMNFISGRFAELAGRKHFVFDAGQFELHENSVPLKNGDALLGIRPQDVALEALDRADVIGIVQLVEFLGQQTVVHVDIGNECVVKTFAARPDLHKAGDKVGLRFSRHQLHFFDAASKRRLAVTAN